MAWENLDLRPFGYAPGGYTFKCIDCPPDTDPMSQWAAKRAWRCQKHALQAMAVAIEFPAPAAGARKATVDGQRPTMGFNINHSVLVKLNQRGLDELKRQHDDLRRRVPTLDPWKPPATDEDGYTKFQLWSLMQELGHLCGLGLEPPFETTIKIILDQK